MNKKIALDIHGVIDDDPEFFSWLSRYLKSKGWEIHVLTGGRLSHNEQMLKDMNIHYDYFFSITDFHIERETPLMPNCPDGQVCVASHLWDPVKGHYCRLLDIDVIVDDTLLYKVYMPQTTEFFLW